MSDSEEPSEKKRRFSMNFFITVKLAIGQGNEKVEINVPKERLCEVSEVLSAACSGGWESKPENVIDLQTEEPKLFSLFLAWAYVGSVEKSEHYHAIEGKKLEDRKEAAKTRHAQMIDCYLLGQRLLAHDFKNAVMDLLVKSYKTCQGDFGIIPIGPPDICRIYANTTAPSPLRRTLVDTVYAISGDDLHKEILLEADPKASRFCLEYMSEVIAAGQLSPGIQKRVYRRRFACYENSLCSYHEHPGMPYGYSCYE